MLNPNIIIYTEIKEIRARVLQRTEIGQFLYLPYTRELPKYRGKYVIPIIILKICKEKLMDNLQHLQRIEYM